jgi:hypothetical protein
LPIAILLTKGYTWLLLVERSKGMLDRRNNIDESPEGSQLWYSPGCLSWW